ncbi:MAG: DUF4265 domain-containing protein [Gemmatimonadaceae bacterium]
MTQTVLLPVFIDGERRGEEALPVAAVGPARFRLLASPGIVEGLAAGNEFVLDDIAPPGYRVVERGGNLWVWFYFAPPVEEHSGETADVRRAVEALGGWLDGGYSKMLVFTVPLAAGFAAVARAFDAAVARQPGSQWLYGNVYDPTDGETPLDWWRL